MAALNKCWSNESELPPHCCSDPLIATTHSHSVTNSTTNHVIKFGNQSQVTKLSNHVLATKLGDQFKGSAIVSTNVSLNNSKECQSTNLNISTNKWIINRDSQKFN
jgi:hypothetical protein